VCWPCSFSNEKGQCVNVSSRHSPKGHQNERGKIIAAGSYQSNKFSALQFRKPWIEMIKQHVAGFQKSLQALIDQPNDRGVSDISYMWDLHATHMNRFFEGLGSAERFVSHATCFCCLLAAPQHSLPCGHVLCTGCVSAYGKKRGSRSLLEMTSCPLHDRETRWSTPWQLSFKPEFAGVRLLCLDGYVQIRRETHSVQFS
jgi:hypothetical protein